MPDHPPAATAAPTRPTAKKALTMTTPPAPSALRTAAIPLHHAFYVFLHVLAREWGYTVPRVFSDGVVEPAESEWGDVEWTRVGTRQTGNQGHFVPVSGHGRGSQFVQAYRHMKASLVADFCGVDYQAARAILRIKYAHDAGVIKQAVEVAEKWATLDRYLRGWKMPECPESHAGMARIGIDGQFSHPRKVAVFRVAEILVRVR